MKSLTIIDTFAFFFRAYYALPPLKSRDGFPTGLLTGFINFIHQLQTSHSTEFIIFALDSKESFRKKIYKEYKANRPAPPQDLMMQLEVAIEWIEKMGFKSLTKEGYEADDIIATAVRFAKEQNIKAKIVSSDKDLYQLLDEFVVLYDWVKKQEINEKDCIKKFGVEPKDFVDFQALIGDSSDNVPGVKGIGPKSASKLINEFHTLENIYNNIDKISNKRIRNLLLEGKELAFISRELVKLESNLFEHLELEEFVFEDRNYLEALKDEFIKYDMNNALKWAVGVENSSKKEKKIEFETIIIDDKEKLKKIISKIEDRVVAFDIETTSLDEKEAKLVGFSFAFEENRAYYVPVAHNYLGVGKQIKMEDAKEAILDILDSNFIGQNLKFDLKVLKNSLNIEPKTPFADTMILAWLLEPGSRVGLDNLAQKFLGYKMKSYKETVKKGENFSDVDIKTAAFYASEDAYITLLLYKKLVEKFNNLDLRGLLKEAREVEFPFILVLIYMESLGIKVDIGYLEEFRERLNRELYAISKEVFELAGVEFNIKSPKQLGEILFNKLGLKGAKKTKSGYSTNEKVLKDLIEAHPIIPKILEFRERQKILSTYVEPLLKFGKRDGENRVYTTFLQTGTATGRLASKEPNLQNIPVRTALGRGVRKAFISKEGYKLVSIDYSQIELRLLAHFSGDEELVRAFREDKDIHLETAIKLFGEEEAREKRDIAKTINFGILYGMGSRKLANELKISVAKAKEIIKSYFEAFPTLKSYFETIEEQVKKEGYITTLLGRRRVFDWEGASAVGKAAILREAVNSVFQGSAADLIKLAMLKIASLIESRQLRANLLLQIHDELIFEIEQSQVEELSKEFANIMESIYPLNIPLKSSISIGNRWDELK
ncbi:MAG: DNA polymerase I [Epsilonproteobacteria bacterium]|nr:DNA polymerase I [Campylobacterota bacterium]